VSDTFFLNFPKITNFLHSQSFLCVGRDKSRFLCRSSKNRGFTHHFTEPDQSPNRINKKFHLWPRSLPCFSELFWNQR
jgi:hypothetical protein